MSDTQHEQKEILLKLLQEAIAQDQALREKLGVGDKFRFIRDQLNKLYEQTKTQLATVHKENLTTANTIASHEKIVYVHLFNAQGALLPTWQKMLKPSLFYEYSVNRPIYADKSAIDTFIKNKSNRQQHAYLAVVVSDDTILPSLEQGAGVDVLGQALIKVKEGSLQFSRLQSFTHNEQTYRVSELGELKKINDAS